MKKFLDCDWLRGMQFLGNTVQKKGNLVQKRVFNHRLTRVNIPSIVLIQSSLRLSSSLAT